MTLNISAPTPETAAAQRFLMRLGSDRAGVGDEVVEFSLRAACIEVAHSTMAEAVEHHRYDPSSQFVVAAVAECFELSNADAARVVGRVSEAHTQATIPLDSPLEAYRVKAFWCSHIWGVEARVVEAGDIDAPSCVTCANKTRLALAGSKYRITRDPSDWVHDSESRRSAARRRLEARRRGRPRRCPDCHRSAPAE